MRFLHGQCVNHITNIKNSVILPEVLMATFVPVYYRPMHENFIYQTL